MEAKILIADDHSIVKMGLTAILNKMGVKQVDTVSNIAELKDAISRNVYTHLVLDIIMPDGNSIELLNKSIQAIQIYLF